MPVCYLGTFDHIEFSDEDDSIKLNGEYYYLSNDVQSFKYGLTDYLVQKCKFDKKALNIHPIIFIKSNSYYFHSNGILINKELTIESIFNYLKQIVYNSVQSYSQWSNTSGFNNCRIDIANIIEKASEDSKTGFLTKRKLDRIGRELGIDKKIYTSVNNTLTILEGKAGTGKTSQMLTLMIKSLKENRNCLFLTYNNLLVFDVAKVIKAFTNNAKELHPIGEASVMTLHRFFYRLSKNLGILHVMSEKRIFELKGFLHKRLAASLKEIKYLIDTFGESIFRGNNYENIKERLLNSRNIDRPTKEVGVDYINYLKKNNLSLTHNVEESAMKFIGYKEVFIEDVSVKNIFLKDYYKVLENTLQALINPPQYYTTFDIGNKYDLLATVFEFNKRKKPDEDLQNGRISEDILKSRIKRVASGQRRKRLLIVDEAQDCHRLERDILFNIFGINNIAIASGGKEQLIRHVELCNWTVSNGRRIPHQVFSSGRKSYRVKSNLLTLCNYLGTQYKINLNLEPMTSEDNGRVILDLRKNLEDKDFENEINNLINNSEIQGCTPYEGLMVLTDAKSIEFQRNADGESRGIPVFGVINEYGNIDEDVKIGRNEWKHLKSLGNIIPYWDGTEEDKRMKMIPAAGEVRYIYYESCRGLEAWNVVCYDLDKFFNHKVEDKEAEKYLIDDLHYTIEERKKMYAATWCLMALTRAIDTLYIKVSSETEFGKALHEFALAHPTKCKVIS